MRFKRGFSRLKCSPQDCAYGHDMTKGGRILGSQRLDTGPLSEVVRKDVPDLGSYSRRGPQLQRQSGCNRTGLSKRIEAKLSEFSATLSKISTLAMGMRSICRWYHFNQGYIYIPVA